MHGTVSEFDARRGLGVVTGEDGRAYPFHSTQIGDGTREMAVGTAVEFDIVPGLPGVWEAAHLQSS